MRKHPEGCGEIIMDNFSPADSKTGTATGQTVMHATLFPATREIRITRQVVAGRNYQDPRRHIIPKQSKSLPEP